MPVLAPRAPSLHKPKSKIRLRLGLTPPHPQPPPPPKVQPVPSARPTAPPAELASTSGNVQSSTAGSSPTAANTSSTLNNSTLTSSSSISRGDSRDAFALEISPSTTSQVSPHHHQFDTISYATASPRSEAINLAAASQTTLNTQLEHPYPTPSPSSSPSRLTFDDNVTQRPPIQSEYPPTSTADQSHPNVARVTAAADDIFSLSDEQLADRFLFVEEIGFGNWGSVWKCKPKYGRASALAADPKGAASRLGRVAAAGGGSGAGGKVAVKLVHREKTPTTAARVRALWGEMKIIRSLRHEPHPSIIQFEAFVITPTYALVIMPFMSHLIPVCLSPRRATPYFRQLASAVGYLHERGITHNDIKPANVLLSYNDVPVLVDFGFAQKWDVGSRGSFLSSISWGTPEYLDPQRAMGMPHDERASDVWSLGITMFEVLIGRTPFEQDDQEEFTTPEEYAVYYERTRRGTWIGKWAMPEDLQHLLRAMICPDPAYRMTAMQAYHHPALQPAAPTVIITPHFVRAAASMEFEGDVPGVPKDAEGEGKKEAKKRKGKKREGGAKENQFRAPTPGLGEAIKQHTSETGLRPVKQGLGERDGNIGDEERTPSPKKVVVKKSREALRVSGENEEDPTPTRVTKPAQELKSKELSYTSGKPADSGVPVAVNEDKNELRDEVTNTALEVKPSQLLHHNQSHRNLRQRDSNLSLATSTSTVVHTKEEAVLKAMRSLEGIRKTKEKHRSKDRDVLSAISRPAPSPPRPRSLDSQVSVDSNKDEQRRSLGVERTLGDVPEEQSPGKTIPTEHSAVMMEARPESSLDPLSGINTPIASPTKSVTSKTASPYREATVPASHIKTSRDQLEVSSPSHITGTLDAHSKRLTSSPASTPTKAGTRAGDSTPKKSPVPVSSPPRPRLATRPTEVVADQRHLAMGHALQSGVESKSQEGLPFPVPASSPGETPLAELRRKILSHDSDSSARYRQVSGDLIAPSSEDINAKLAPAISGIDGDNQAYDGIQLAERVNEDARPQQAKQRNYEASGLEGKLDQLSLWVKDVERIVEDARKAIAEGREPPASFLELPTNVPLPMTASISLSQEAMAIALASDQITSDPASAEQSTEDQGMIDQTDKAKMSVTVSTVSEDVKKIFGVTADQNPMPAHLRTASTQVEPATPPKWMTEQEAQERVKKALESTELAGSAPMGAMKRGQKKERPTVSHVLKLFGNDKSDKHVGRSHTPEPLGTIPLKAVSSGHTLRGAPSTPALRSSTTRQSTKPLARKSESNLRNFNTAPTSFLSSTEVLRPDTPTSPMYPRRAVYEDLLDSNPGVVRQGDGWSSMSNGKAMAKPSSIASLRERALAFLRDDKDRDGRDPRDIARDSEQKREKENRASTVSGTMGVAGRQIVDLAQVVDHDKRVSKGDLPKRPGTPGGNSIFNVHPRNTSEGKNKGIFGRWMGKWGKKQDEA